MALRCIYLMVKVLYLVSPNFYPIFHYVHAVAVFPGQTLEWEEKILSKKIIIVDVI